jgi:hypothetical protein
VLETGGLSRQVIEKITVQNGPIETGSPGMASQLPSRRAQEQWLPLIRSLTTGRYVEDNRPFSIAAKLPLLTR